MSRCSADVGHRCDVNDGEPCARCAKYEAESMAEAWRLWRAADPIERDPIRYEREMREAGRGHLLR